MNFEVKKKILVLLFGLSNSGQVSLPLKPCFPRLKKSVRVPTLTGPRRTAEECRMLSAKHKVHAWWKQPLQNSKHSECCGASCKETKGEAQRLQHLEESQSHYNQAAILVRLVEVFLKKKLKRSARLTIHSEDCNGPSGHLVLPIRLPPSQ